MRSIIARYNLAKEKESALSSYALFATAIAGQGFGKGVIRKNFTDLVDRDDYKGVRKEDMIQAMFELTSIKVAGNL
jgi:hypothetical protein